MNWHEMYLKMAAVVAEKSQDASTKHGCVLVAPDHTVLSVGYNGLPRGMAYTEARQKRPEKYFWFEHSERNAIYNACRNGVSLKCATCYVTGYPCADCARGLIQAGICEVIIPPSIMPEHWAQSANAALEMFHECGVAFMIYDGKVLN